MKKLVKYRIVSFRDRWLPPIWKLQCKIPLSKKWKTIGITAEPQILTNWVLTIGLKNLEIKRHA